MGLYQPLIQVMTVMWALDSKLLRSMSLALRISGFLDTKFDTVDIEFGTSVNELDRPPCRELHEPNDCLKRLAIHRLPAIPS